jgi:hypothetical protein
VTGQQLLLFDFAYAAEGVSNEFRLNFEPRLTAGLPVTESHIVPVLVGDPQRC